MATTTDTIWGGPTKRFFVSMLTRDIELSDAILDLIDNSVDGATRKLKGKITKEDAYKGYETRITLSKKSFDIADNCGGIPESAIKDAFLLGRPKIDKDAGIPTIGMYGIGMKRAIFKIGEEAEVESRSDDGAFAVSYTTEWLDPENEDWDLPIRKVRNTTKKGVTIVIPTLRKDISKSFGNESFVNALKAAVAEHFGYLIQKGFSIFVNEEEIRPQTLELYYTEHEKKNGIRPYEFVAEENGVHIRVSVGFFRSLTRLDEIDEAATRSETVNAGISVICNDRLVLLNDRSSKTGWGDGGVPRYHPQFRSIAGFIIFSTDEPEKLPISTTKRDLDVGEEVYLFARQYCMEGLRQFTSFTNKWKGMEEEAEKFFNEAVRKNVRTHASLASSHGSKIRGRADAKKYLANLPVPEVRNPLRRISFAKKDDAIRELADFLFGNSDEKPAVVGEECFDRALQEARK
ncbi:ATP-binding protein [Thermomonas carbonis]|uniref:ATP-binding protein n=1 Tax=Thermomonas carbonis TaxID=1463158 RepID=A0A7G9SS65_9GAMM|nr:ATP-binding protein [Thermomonas carbonis]QNN70690.1 ATP-binding protein [Thermomonas carbonis]GHC01669.1 ATPase [Thermomonas carbonis]